MRKSVCMLAPLGLALLLVASLFVPSVAFADDDGYTGSGGGSFGWVPNTNWSGFDIYIGSVYESLYGGGGEGGGHAFGEDGYYGSGGGTFSGKSTDSSSSSGSGSSGTGSGEDTALQSTYTLSGVLNATGSITVHLSDTVKADMEGYLSEHPYITIYTAGNKIRFELSSQKYTFGKYSGYSDAYSAIYYGGSDNGKYVLWECSYSSGSTEFTFSSTAKASGAYTGPVPRCAFLDSSKTSYVYMSYVSEGGGSGSSEPEPEPFVYPSEDTDTYNEPTGGTPPDLTLPTVGTQTTTTGDTVVVTDVDLSPVTARQDIANTYLYGIITDLDSMYSMVWSEFDEFEAEIYDLGDYLGRLMYLNVVMGMQSNDLLYQINEGIAGLDQDTDAIDLSGINTRLDTLISSIGNLPNYDDTGLISSITGSGGSDLLGLYGRLDTMLNWLDAYTGYDDTGLIDAINGAVYDDANLITTIENAAYDDSSLVNAIVGSHGVDVLGLFGRLDTISNWLDAYTGFDDTELLTLVENIYDAVNNFQDENTAVTTIRGDVRLVADRLASVLDWLDGYTGYDDAALMEDLGIMRTSLTDAVGTLVDVDESLRLLSDELTLTTSSYGLTTIRSYISGMHSFLSSVEQYAYNILVELREYANDFVSYWSAVTAKLDSVLAAIERIGTHQPRQYPSLPTDGDDYNVYDDVLHLGELKDALARLMAKFPFSVVSDIALIFAALVRPAEAPVFSVPVPNPSDWGSPHYLTVDLSQFDVVASVLRVGLVLWAIARVSRRTLNLWTREE